MAGLLADQGVVRAVGPAGPLPFQFGLTDASRLNGGFATVPRLRDIRRVQAIAGVAAGTDSVVGSRVDDLSIRLAGTRASDPGVASLDPSTRVAADAAVAAGGGWTRPPGPSRR